jgi:hypothetical protein
MPIQDSKAPMPPHPTTGAAPSFADGLAFEALMQGHDRRDNDDDAAAGDGSQRIERNDSEPDDRRVTDKRSGDKEGDTEERRSQSRGDDPAAPAEPAPAAQQAWLAQPQAPVALPAAVAPPPMATMSWQQMCASVERLLVGEAARQGPAAMFTLSPELLDDTTVTLARTAQGWSLRIQTQDADLLDDLDAHEEELRRRFARHGLGDISIEPVAHSSSSGER